MQDKMGPIALADDGLKRVTQPHLTPVQIAI